MNIWEKLFGKIGLWVIPLIILAWIGQLAAVHIFKRSEIKQTILAEKRAEEIKILYSSLLEASELINQVYYSEMPIIEPSPMLPDDVDKAIEKIEVLVDLAETQKIYYPANIADLIDEMCGSLRDASRDMYRRKQIMDEYRTRDISPERKQSIDEERQQLESQTSKTLEKIRDVVESLEQRLPNLLGVR